MRLSQEAAFRLAGLRQVGGEEGRGARSDRWRGRRGAEGGGATEGPWDVDGGGALQLAAACLKISQF